MSEASTVRSPLTPVGELAPSLFASPGGGRTPTFHGRASTLFGIFVVNVFLTLATLGLYYFWARVRLRRYLLGQTEVDGDRFEYHGRGLEVLVGFAKAFFFFGLNRRAVARYPGPRDRGDRAVRPRADPGGPRPRGP
jgi:hypothetical protein